MTGQSQNSSDNTLALTGTVSNGNTIAAIGRQPEAPVAPETTFTMTKMCHHP